MVDMVAIADSQGMITFHDMMGEVLLHYDAGHNGAITAMDFDGQDGGWATILYEGIIIIIHHSSFIFIIIIP